MKSRRAFFKIAASFAAGCAMNVGALVSTKVPIGIGINPEWKNAHYIVAFFSGSVELQDPEIRTNNPNFLKDGLGYIPKYAPIYD